MDLIHILKDTDYNGESYTISAFGAIDAALEYARSYRLKLMKSCSVPEYAEIRGIDVCDIDEVTLNLIDAFDADGNIVD